MKKLVLRTQFMENYGAHDWDGEGECPQYWKPKGGSTYVFYGLTAKMEAKIDRDGIPTLESLIEHDNEYSREYIRSMDIVDVSEQVAEDWESIHILTYDRKNKQWNCAVEHEPHVPKHDIRVVLERWVMEPEGKRQPCSYQRFYLVKDEWKHESEILAATMNG